MLFISLPFLGLVSSALALTTHIHDDTFVPDAILRVSAANISIGGIHRYTTLINGTVPGPELRLPEGRVTWVRVYNDMTDRNTTIHWHGLAQAAYPFSDGTPEASQWPIPPQHYFDYELQLANGSAGTYFYHSHVGFQFVSASGPLIIEDAATLPYQTDGEKTIHIQELFNKTDAQAEAGLVATPLGWTGETNGFLINGKTISNFGIVDNSTAKLAVIEVEPEQTYRFRFIASTSLSVATLAFDSHSALQVIEADGAYTKPVSTDLLQLGSGQRFSTLFKTKTCNELNQSGKLDYYLQIESRERPSNITNFAILRYKDCCGLNSTSATRVSTSSYPATPPVKLPPTIYGFLDYKLAPLVPNNFPSASEVTRRIIINAQQIVDRYTIWRDANVSWVDSGTQPLLRDTPDSPYLVALYENDTSYLPNYDAAVANGGVDPKTQTFPAKIGEVLEIVLQNVGSHTGNTSTGGGLDAHPWHAHGRHYYDLGGGPGAWSSSVMESQLNGTQPIERDTTMLYRYGTQTKQDEVNSWRAWRLRVQNPGVWMIHCHFLQHMLMGMQTVWVFGEPKDILTVPKPEVEGFLVYGGDVVGNETHYPTVVHFNEVEGLRRRKL